MAFAGVEIGDGAIIQSYLDEYSRDKIFQDKSCMIYALEVLPEYRQAGLQRLLWKKLCEHAKDDDIYSIIWDPQDEEKYKKFLEKFKIIHKEHLLSQVTEFGEHFDGETTKFFLSENVTKFFQLENDEIDKLHREMEMTTQHLNVRDETFFNRQVKQSIV